MLSGYPLLEDEIQKDQDWNWNAQQPQQPVLHLTLQMVLIVRVSRTTPTFSKCSVRNRQRLETSYVRPLLHYPAT